MKTTNLFEEVLINPIKEGAEKLYVISGYATASMASTHLSRVKEKLNREISLNLIVGMSPVDGISRSDHNGFLELTDDSEMGNFTCSYIVENCKPVHSKVYIWAKDNEPVTAFAGSANYTQNAFFRNQREVLTWCDPILAFKYYESLIDDTIFSNYLEVEDHVTIHNRIPYRRRPDDEQSDTKIDGIQTEGLEKVTCTLLPNRKNIEIHTKAGLNWGQRGTRNRNEAYIPVSVEIQRSGFFPDSKVHFTVLITRCTSDSSHVKSISSHAITSYIGIIGDQSTKLRVPSSPV